MARRHDDVRRIADGEAASAGAWGSGATTAAVVTAATATAANATAGGTSESERARITTGLVWKVGSTTARRLGTTARQDHVVAPSRWRAAGRAAAVAAVAGAVAVARATGAPRDEYAIGEIAAADANVRGASAACSVHGAVSAAIEATGCSFVRPFAFAAEYHGDRCAGRDRECALDARSFAPAVHTVRRTDRTDEIDIDGGDADRQRERHGRAAVLVHQRAGARVGATRAHRSTIARRLSAVACRSLAVADRLRAVARRRARRIRKAARRSKRDDDHGGRRRPHHQ